MRVPEVLFCGLIISVGEPSHQKKGKRALLGDPGNEPRFFEIPEERKPKGRFIGVLAGAQCERSLTFRER